MGDYDDDNERLAFEDQLYQDEATGSASDASDDEHELALINYNHSFTLDHADDDGEEEEEDEEQNVSGNLLKKNVSAFSLKHGEDEERSSDDMEISDNDMPIVISSSSSESESETSEPVVQATRKSPETLRVVQMRTSAPAEPSIELKHLLKDTVESRRKVRHVGQGLAKGILCVHLLE
ncbi:hypothetical protein HDU86_004494 [Geranomyces michiganensis]|nr:hypothetical protein HDU86_004494 [Geranomyces michiganensis]